MNKIKGFFQKCGSWVKKNTNKLCMMAGVPVMPFAAEEAIEPLTEGTGVDVSGMLTSIKGFFSDFSVDNLILIIGAALSLGVILFLFWFAYRLIKRQVVKAITKGNV